MAQLGDGVKVQFVAGRSPNYYRLADYWQIPAQAATGHVMWLNGESGPLALAPQGPPRYLAPLALVEGPKDVVDLRSQFVNLAFPDEDDEDDE